MNISNFLFLDSVDEITVSNEFTIPSNGLTFTFEVSGTFTGVDLKLQGKVDRDSEQWTTISVVDILTSSSISSITTTGLYKVGVGGLYSIRMSLDNIDSGSIKAMGKLVDSRIYPSLDTKWVDKTFYVNAIDEPPINPSIWDDEFDGALLDSKWSWINQGTAVQTFKDGAARLEIPPAGGISLRTLIQDAPTVPFSVISKLRMYTYFVNSQNSGIVLYNSVTGKYVTCVLGINENTTNTGIIKWNSYSEYDSDARVSIDRYRYSLYLKMSYNAGIVTTYWSPDGVEWFQSALQDASAFIGIPDKIGIYGNSENSGIGEISYFDWFRVTE